MAKKGKSLWRYLLTGFITILPLVLTFYLIQILVSFIGSFFSPFLKPFVLRVFGSGYSQFFLELISFLILLILLWIVGFVVANLIIGKSLFAFLERVLIRVPLVSGIYTTFKKITEFISPSSQKKFRRVVLVPFPRPGSYALGFVTGEGTEEIQEKTKEFLFNIFVPTTPNPTSGFLIFVPKGEVIPLTMSVDDAIKMIISGGISVPKFKKEKEEAPNEI